MRRPNPYSFGVALRGIIFSIIISSFWLGPISQSQALGAAPSCVLLFTLGAPALSDAQEYSLRRFQTSLERSRDEDLSPMDFKWRRKINAPIYFLKNLLRINRETHASLHMSPNENFVVSKSSEGIFRVIDANTGKIISQAPNIRSEIHSRAEVIQTSNHYYVVAVDSTSYHDRSLGLDGFHPHHLKLFDRNSRLVREYVAEGRMKNSVISNDGRFWLNASQGNFDITDLSTQKISPHWIGEIQTSEHPKNFELIVNAVQFSLDGQSIALVAGDSKGRSQAILFLIPLKSLMEARSTVRSILAEIEIPLGRVYRVDGLAGGGWRIEGIAVNESHQSAVQVLEMP